MTPHCGSEIGQHLFGVLVKQGARMIIVHTTTRLARAQFGAFLANMEKYNIDKTWLLSQVAPKTNGILVLSP